MHLDYNKIYNTNYINHHGDYFTASVCYSALTNSSYFDYMHLVFWFFFLTVFLISTWLIYTFVFITVNSEKNKPSLETRGFSRAQTGDTLTAIIPMTWSITMLMHANSNSSNFDENTDSTIFNLTIIAYQWGWNYFLPKDLIEKNNNDDYSELFKLNNNIKKEDTKSVYRLYIKINKSLDKNFFKNNTFINNLDFINNNNITKISNISNKFSQNKNILFSKKSLINIPLCLNEIDEDFNFTYSYNELSSSRNSIEPRFNKLELFGGLTHRLNINSSIVLPSDVNIHVICGSKDVIHSWAVPGLFLKIDCIPGYNCHRRVLLRWRGMYWGQCMEVCGRYHHWMPILVKVTHYDLFLLWLKSFIA